MYKIGTKDHKSKMKTSLFLIIKHKNRIYTFSWDVQADGGDDWKGGGRSNKRPM